MKTRVEAFIERLANEDGGLDSLSRELNAIGQNELAKKMYALYTEAYLIHREFEHQAAQIA